MLKLWKYSKIRFYIKNAIWNYRFWIFSKKQFKTVTYTERDFFSNPIKEVNKRKFVGYLYKGSLYQDNPGMPISDKDVWSSWHKKGLI